MDKKSPTAAQFCELARELKNKVSPIDTKIDILTDKFSQAMLLIANNMSGNGRLAVLELQKELLAETQPFRSNPERTFYDTFSGQGQLASYLRQKASFQDVSALYPQLEKTAEGAMEMLQDLERFNYQPYEDEQEQRQLAGFLAELQVGAANLMPYSFVLSTTPGGILSVLGQTPLSEVYDAYPAGFYEDLQMPIRDDGSMPWVLLVKGSIGGARYFPAEVMLLLRQGLRAQLMIRHPFEDVWYEWDHKHLLPGLVEEVVSRYSFLSLTLMRATSRPWDFQEEIKQLVAKNRKFLWQHEILPMEVVFFHVAGQQQQQYADFMWADNSARLTVRTDDVFMVFYCTKRGGNWDQEVRFMRPQHPGLLISIPVDAATLSEQQQRVLVQRATQAIRIKNHLIQQHQQATKEPA